MCCEPADVVSEGIGCDNQVVVNCSSINKYLFGPIVIPPIFPLLPWLWSRTKCAGLLLFFMSSRPSLKPQRLSDESVWDKLVGLSTPFRVTLLIHQQISFDSTPYPIGARSNLSLITPEVTSEIICT